MKLPENFDKDVGAVFERVRNVEGFMSPKEVRFLFLLGACPTTEGEVLEIGSFKGKSTIVLAKAVACAGGSRIVAVDPLTSPAVTDPALDSGSGLDEFRKNIEAAGIEDIVEFHQKYSYEVARNWDRKLRLLWIDGDHTYTGTKTDFELFFKYLSNGAIVAFHDVMHAEYDGPMRVFMDRVLLSEKFGPAGLCGSMGWAQYLEGVDNNTTYGRHKYKLYRKLSRFIPFSVFGKEASGFNKRIFKLYRAMVLHDEPKPEEWLGTVVFKQ